MNLYRRIDPSDLKVGDTIFMKYKTNDHMGQVGKVVEVWPEMIGFLPNDRPHVGHHHFVNIITQLSFLKIHGQLLSACDL